MEDIARTLRKDGELVGALAADRASRFNDANIEAEMREDMRRQASEILDSDR